jgi:hypothetical protein
MTHEPSRKKCLITGRTLNATAFGKSGCSSYSKKAINHYQLLRRTVNEQGYELSIADYREYMGYPPLVHGNLNTEAQDEGVKVVQFLNNRITGNQDFQKVEPEPEQTRQKKCGNCGTLGHNRRTCPELVEQVEQPVGKYDRRIEHIENWITTKPDVNDDTLEVIEYYIARMKRSDESRQEKCWYGILAECRSLGDDSPIRRGRPSSK